MSVFIRQDASTIAARMAGASGEMDAAAHGIMSRAVSLSHHRTGHYAASFSVKAVPGKSGVMDRLVSNSDPAALAIECGYVTRNGRYVPGQHILRRAI